MEILKQLGRTLVMMAVMAAAVYLSILIMVKLHFPPYVIVGGVAVLVLAMIIFSAPLHAYWAPVSTRVNALKWVTAEGTKMETVVENAIVQAGQYVRSTILRVSIYEVESRKRIFRRLIGDDATYLGRHGIGVWFHIADRFHARRDGLVCVDLETGKWLYHTPRSETPYLSPTDSSGVFEIEDEDENVLGKINLRELKPNL